jgi:hypothetical protein
MTARKFRRFHWACKTAHEQYNSSDSEPPIITMGSVIANAIHGAAGARLL